MEGKNKKIRAKILIKGLMIFLISLLLTGIILAADVGVDSPSRVDAAATFFVDVNIYEVTNFNGAQFKLTFDPDVLQVVDVVKGSLVTDDYTLNSNENPAGILIILIEPQNPTGINGSGSLVRITFNATGSEGASSNLNITKVILGDLKGFPIAINQINNDKVTIFSCDLNNDGIYINDWNELMYAYKCHLGINNCGSSYQNWNLLKQEYECFINNM